MQIVPFQEKHIVPFTSWFNALPNNHVWTESSVWEKTIQDPLYDPALMIAVEQDGLPLGLILGSIANETGWVRAFIVHPDHQRSGIGTLLFDTLERTFAGRGIADIHVGWALPKYFIPGVDVNYTSAIVFLDRRGYQTNREARVNMDVQLVGRDLDTQADQTRLAGQGITVRRARPDDRTSITVLCETHNHYGWAIETGMGLAKDPVTVFVAEREGQICAFATHSVCGPIHFGPMLTAPDLRGLGIGSVLLKCCLLDWQRAGVERCEIVWAGPLAFYARAVGATMGRAFWAFHKTL